MHNVASCLLFGHLMHRTCRGRVEGCRAWFLDYWVQSWHLSFQMF